MEQGGGCENDGWGLAILSDEIFAQLDEEHEQLSYGFLAERKANAKVL